MKLLQKGIVLPEEIVIDIKYRKLKEQFNFSGWITKEYKKQFMSDDYLEFEPPTYETKIKKIEKRLEDIEADENEE